MKINFILLKKKYCKTYSNNLNFQLQKTLFPKKILFFLFFFFFEKRFFPVKHAPIIFMYNFGKSFFTVHIFEACVFSRYFVNFYWGKLWFYCIYYYQLLALSYCFTFSQNWIFPRNILLLYFSFLHHSNMKISEHNLGLTETSKNQHDPAHVTIYETLWVKNWTIERNEYTSRI